MDSMGHGITKTYNGWANYPTWAVNLWLSNDEGLYRETLDRVESARRGAATPDDYDRVNTIRIGTADAIEHYVQELAPDLGASFPADLLGWALGQVDWLELADAWLEERAEELA